MKEPLATDDEDLFTHEVMFEKNPPMPQIPQSNFSDDFHASQRVSNNRADELYFQFLKELNSNDSDSAHPCPEFNGYNTKVTRVQGHKVNPKTNVVYLSMIDKPPADPATIQASMVPNR